MPDTHAVLIASVALALAGASLVAGGAGSRPVPVDAPRPPATTARAAQAPPVTGASDLDAAAVAAYRLTPPVFARFETASRRIGALTRDDPRYSNAPLFTREVAMLGDVRAVAVGLEARLKNDPGLAGALGAAKITTREYTTFAIALIAARLAQGFVAAGVLRNVPPGPASDNIAFVTAHEAAVSTILAELGVSGLPDGVP